MCSCSYSGVSETWGSSWLSPALPRLCLPNCKGSLNLAGQTRVCKTHASLPLRMQCVVWGERLSLCTVCLLPFALRSENVKLCKTILALKKKKNKNELPSKLKRAAGTTEVPEAQTYCSAGWWRYPKKLTSQKLWDWITVSLSWSGFLGAAGCHGMAMEGKKWLQSRKKTNKQNLSETCQ